MMGTSLTAQSCFGFFFLRYGSLMGNTMTQDLAVNCELRGTDNVQGQISDIFSPQMEAIVFIILQIFFATHAIFKIGEYSRIFHSFSRGIFGHVTHLNQSRASEKI